MDLDKLTESQTAEFMACLTKGTVEARLNALTVLAMETRKSVTKSLTHLYEIAKHQNALVQALAEKFIEVARAYTGEGMIDPAGTLNAVEQIQGAAQADLEELNRIFDLSGPTAGGAPEKT